MQLLGTEKLSCKGGRKLSEGCHFTTRSLDAEGTLKPVAASPTSFMIAARSSGAPSAEGRRILRTWYATSSGSVARPHFKNQPQTDRKVGSASGLFRSVHLRTAHSLLRGELTSITSAVHPASSKSGNALRESETLTLNLSKWRAIHLACSIFTHVSTVSTSICVRPKMFLRSMACCTQERA